MTTTFVWGLKRSGIHLVTNWMYANYGAIEKSPLEAPDLHPQLRDGFRDRTAGVAFHNNCGWLHSRGFSIGTLTPADFNRASERQRVTIFGLEDCDLCYASRVPVGPEVSHVLVLRDPLNNIASRLEGAKVRPEVFRVDHQYIALFGAYCEEYLGWSTRLPHKTRVSYNQFVTERGYRDQLAAQLGVVNLDAVSDVSPYGGGSSFSGDGRADPAHELLLRYRRHPVPRRLVAMLAEHPAVRSVCSEIFGYDLAVAAAAR